MICQFCALAADIGYQHRPCNRQGCTCQHRPHPPRAPRESNSEPDLVEFDILAPTPGGPVVSAEWMAARTNRIPRHKPKDQP